MVSLDPTMWRDMGYLEPGESFEIRSGSGELIRTIGGPTVNMELPNRLTPKVMIAFIDESDPDGPITWMETLPVRSVDINHGMDDYPTMTIEVVLIK